MSEPASLREQLEAICTRRPVSHRADVCEAAGAMLNAVCRVLDGVEFDFRVQRQLHDLRAALPRCESAVRGPLSSAADFAATRRTV